MKEVLRIIHACKKHYDGGNLIDYNLEVFEGEIVYIQSLYGNEIKPLARLFAGEIALDSGRIYLAGKEVADYSIRNAYRYQIYPITTGKDVIDGLSVAENIELIRKVPFAGKIYSKRKILYEVERYLKSMQMDVRASALGLQLTDIEKHKLSIMRAKMHGAKVIILNVTNGTYEGKESEELCNIVKDFSKAGIAFVVLSEQYNMLANVADRIQIIHHGRDIKEWYRLTDSIHSSIVSQDRFVAEYLRNNKKSVHKNFVGLFDYEWKTDKNIWEYLEQLKKHNHMIWTEYINVDIPKPYRSIQNKTVVIPKDSGEKLLMGLNIEDNIIITIPDRVSRNRWKLIRKSVCGLVTDDYYDIVGLDRNVTELRNLNRIQRKILSVYRWVIARPDCIVLENPYWGMDSEEISMFRDYLASLCDQGIRVFYFAKSLEEMKTDCKMILTSRSGKKAFLVQEQKNGSLLSSTKINTKRKKIPPCVK